MKWVCCTAAVRSTPSAVSSLHPMHLLALPASALCYNSTCSWFCLSTAFCLILMGRGYSKLTISWLWLGGESRGISGSSRLDTFLGSLASPTPLLFWHIRKDNESNITLPHPAVHSCLELLTSRISLSSLLLLQLSATAKITLLERIRSNFRRVSISWGKRLELSINRAASSSGLRII